MRKTAVPNADVPERAGTNQLDRGLYERLLGESWQVLPLAVRKAHCRGVALRARGVFSIRQGTGVVPRMICWLLRMPAPSNALATGLEIAVQGDTEHWKRSFGRHRLSTVQMADGGNLLIERFSLLQFWFQLHARPDGLYFEPQQTAVQFGTWSVRIPACCAPLISAFEAPDEEQGTRVTVRVNLPLIGLLIEYSGILEEPRPHP